MSYLNFDTLPLVIVVQGSGDTGVGVVEEHHLCSSPVGAVPVELS